VSPPLDEIPPLFSTGLSTEAGRLRWRVTETISTLREVVLMAKDLAPIVPEEVCEHDDVVIFVHGFFATAGVFRPMRQRIIEETGSKVASFTHAPGVSIVRIAKSLSRIVDRIAKCKRVHLVGHSLGGLVARYYVQELGGHERVTQTISLASPFGGTELARRFPILVGRELSRTSDLLARLRARAHEHDVHHTSIVGDDDTMIVPRESAIFPRGDVIVLPNRGHNSLLFDAESILAVTERVKLAQRT
jgi:pimeloyl-ACP methyl ester carboxylesterase